MATSSVTDALLERLEAAERRRARVRAVERVWNELPDRTTAAALDVAARWIAAQVEAIGAAGCVFGASGGVDSSLVAVLLRRALPPERTLALILPCGGAPEDEALARRLCEALGLPCRLVPIEDEVDALERRFGGPAGDATVRGNLAARVRAAALYYEANRAGRLVVGTGDLDESYIGYSSKGTTSDLFPITGLHKDEVRALLRLGLAEHDPALAERLAGRPASPGFFPGQSAEREIGIAYGRLAAALDVVIAHCAIEEGGVVPRDPDAIEAALGEGKTSAEDLLRVVDLIAKNYHKAFGSPALWRP